MYLYNVLNKISIVSLLNPTTLFITVISIFIITIFILIFIYLKKQANKLEYAKNQANSLAADRNFIIRGFNHEIRTPLTAISSFLQAYIIANSELSKKPQANLNKICSKNMLCDRITKEGFVYMQEAVTHISTILDNLSSFGEDTSKYTKGTYDLNNLTKIGVKYAKFTDEAKMVETSSIKYQELDNAVNVLISPSKYIQILQNILRNSVRAICEAKPLIPIINVSLQVGRDCCSICIYDNGVGMSKEVITHCKDKYWTKYKNKGGTGLGLYLVSRYIEEFNGTMVIESIEGKSTSIYLNLPLAKNNT